MLEKIREIVAEQMNLDISGIREDTSFKDDLGADSLDLFEVVMSLEEEFDIELPQEEVSNLNTIAEVAEYLKSRGVED